MPRLLRFRTFLSALLLVVMSLTCSASEIRNEFNDAWWVTKKMAAAPFHGSAKDYIAATMVVAGVAASAALDHRLRTEIPKLHGSYVTTINKIGHEAQGPIAIFGTAGALYAGGLLADKPALKRTGIEIVESYAFAAAGTHVLKRAIGRHRPYLDDGNDAFTPFTLVSNKYHSFPSGDVTVVFATASVISAEAKCWPVTVATYGIGAMTAFQRIHKDQHWFSDTVGAAALSTAVGLAVVHYNRQLETSKAGPKVSLGPGGIGLLWSF